LRFYCGTITTPCMTTNWNRNSGTSHFEATLTRS